MKIYIINGQSGYGEEYQNWNTFAFTNKEDAENKLNELENILSTPVYSHLEIKSQIEKLKLIDKKIIDNDNISYIIEEMELL